MYDLKFKILGWPLIAGVVCIFILAPATSSALAGQRSGERRDRPL